MAQAVLERVLKDLDELAPAELERLGQVIQERLGTPTVEERRAAFHQALLDSGLVTEIKPPRRPRPPEPLLGPAIGKPVSETIIEERR